MSGYIDVDAFEKRLEEERKYLILREQYGAEHILVHHAINILVEFPTSDVVEAKHGEWLGKPLGGYSTVRCSVCRNAFLENSGKWNFCPNCGADMRERRKKYDREEEEE